MASLPQFGFNIYGSYYYTYSNAQCSGYGGVYTGYAGYIMYVRSFNVPAFLAAFGSGRVTQLSAPPLPPSPPPP